LMIRPERGPGLALPPRSAGPARPVGPLTEQAHFVQGRPFFDYETPAGLGETGAAWFLNRADAALRGLRAGPHNGRWGPSQKGGPGEPGPAHGSCPPIPVHEKPVVEGASRAPFSRRKRPWAGSAPRLSPLTEGAGLGRRCSTAKRPTQPKNLMGYLLGGTLLAIWKKPNSPPFFVFKQPFSPETETAR